MEARRHHINPERHRIAADGVYLGYRYLIYPRTFSVR